MASDYKPFGCFTILMWIYSTVTWIINLIKFINCDFVEPFKEEAIHLLGVILPPASWVTAWL